MISDGLSRKIRFLQTVHSISFVAGPMGQKRYFLHYRTP